MNTTDQPSPDFEEILDSEITSVRCGRCGADTIMNSVYTKHVKGPLLSCGRCRSRDVAR